MSEVTAAWNRRLDLQEPKGTDPDFLSTALVALACGAVVVAALNLPFIGSTSIGSMLARGDWVAWAVMIFGCWSAALLILKAVRLRHEFRALSLPISTSATSNNGFLESVPATLQKTFFVTRMENGFAHIRDGLDFAMLSTLGSQEDELCQRKVQQSFSTLRVLIWAIPMLGFLGTVIGIGDAIASFASGIQSGQNLDEVRTALIGVTSGLARAFDTTLIALAVSIVMMIPATLLERSEESILTAVALRFDQEVLARRARTTARRRDPVDSPASVEPSGGDRWPEERVDPLRP